MAHPLVAQPHNTISIAVEGPRGYGKSYLIKKISQMLEEANFQHSIVEVQSNGNVLVGGGYITNDARPVQFPILAKQALIVEEIGVPVEPKKEVATTPPLDAQEDRLLRNMALDYAIRTCGNSSAQTTLDTANNYYKFLVG